MTGATGTATVTLADFFHALHPPDSRGVIDLRALPSKRQAFVLAGNIEAVERFIRAYSQQNIYFGVAVRKSSGDGSLKNCGKLYAIFSEVDFKTISETDARAKLERFPLKPSIIIQSGGGLHVYWLLREPLDLQDPEDRQRACSLLRRLALVLGGDMSSAEPVRILRLPGTLNHKPEYGTPRHVLIEVFNPGLRYNPSDLDDLLPREPEPTTNGNGHEQRADWLTLLQGVSKGGRYGVATRIAGHFLGIGRPVEEVETLILGYLSQCNPPGDAEEREKARRMVRDFAAKDAATAEADESEAETASDEVLTFPALAWRGVFETYRLAFEGTSETPDVFHFAGLWLAAALRLQRRLNMFYGYTLHPNVYHLLFALTGESKTTTLRQAADLLPGDGRIKKLAGVGSAEALADWLKQPEEGPGVGHVLLLEELASLLTRGRWEGSTLIPFFTEVFDTPTAYEIPFRKNPVKLAEPTVSLVACTTPDWFWRGMREVDIFGGFGNRFLMLTGTPKDPVAMPKKPHAERLEAVNRALNALDNVPSCEVSLAPDAAKLWQSFYAAWRTEPFDPLTKAATKRIPSYILKLAMTYAALEGTVPTITEAQLAAAIAVGHYASKCSALLMGQHQAHTEEGRVEEAIRQRLRERSHTKRSLKNALGGRIRATLFNRVLEAMIRSCEVTAKEGTRSGQVILTLAGRCK